MMLTDVSHIILNTEQILDKARHQLK